MYNDAKIQMLDLPGIIEGAAYGKGRGRQVVACAKTADLILIVLDAGKEGISARDVVVPVFDDLSRIAVCWWRARRLSGLGALPCG